MRTACHNIMVYSVMQHVQIPALQAVTDSQANVLSVPSNSLAVPATSALQTSMVFTVIRAAQKNVMVTVIEKQGSAIDVNMVTMETIVTQTVAIVSIEYAIKSPESVHVTKDIMEQNVCRTAPPVRREIVIVLLVGVTRVASLVILAKTVMLSA